MSNGTEVNLEEKRCRLYGICVSILPDVFATPAGSPSAVLLRTSVDEDERDDLDEAVRYCPAQAISVQTTGTP